MREPKQLKCPHCQNDVYLVHVRITVEETDADVHNDWVLLKEPRGRVWYVIKPPPEGE